MKTGSKVDPGSELSHVVILVLAAGVPCSALTAISEIQNFCFKCPKLTLPGTRSDTRHDAV